MILHEFTLELVPPQKNVWTQKSLLRKHFEVSLPVFFTYFPGMNLGDVRPLAVATMKKVWLLQLECWSSMPPVRNQKWLKIEM